MGTKMTIKEIEEEEIEEAIMIAITRNDENSLIWREMIDELSTKRMRKIAVVNFLSRASSSVFFRFRYL